jgi:hypothetical protein
MAYRKRQFTIRELVLLERALRNLGEFVEPADFASFRSLCEKLPIDLASIPALAAPTRPIHR